jgi:NAD(P)-dependent dehydrogenase (short-subunit alcohol dehydrogenase family)
MPLDDLKDRVAIVTGASRGIGGAIVDALADRGAKVVLSSRKQADLDAEAKRINEAHPGAAFAVAAHAGRSEDLERLVDATLEHFGRIDILVNNAATNPHFGHTLDADLALWDKTFEVNVRGVYRLTQLAVERYMGEHGGAIVNVASVGGIRVAFGLGIYNVTKAAVIHLTKQLALELGPRGIRVNAVSPGAIATRLTDERALRELQPHFPLGRPGRPEDVARIAAVLLSEEWSGYVTGANVPVDGGLELITWA